LRGVSPKSLGTIGSHTGVGRTSWPGWLLSTEASLLSYRSLRLYHKGDTREKVSGNREGSGRGTVVGLVRSVRISSMKDLNPSSPTHLKAGFLVTSKCVFSMSPRLARTLAMSYNRLTLVFILLSSIRSAEKLRAACSSVITDFQVMNWRRNDWHKMPRLLGFLRALGAFD
jgi:hypothetical protein